MWVRSFLLRNGQNGIRQARIHKVIRVIWSPKKGKKIAAREQMFAKYIFDRGLILGFNLTPTKVT